MEYALNMPAVTFLAMLKQGRRLHAHHLAELCDIAAIPMCSPKYHERLKGMYLSLSARPTSRPAVPQPGLSGDDAKYFMMRLFAGKKGGR